MAHNKLSKAIILTDLSYKIKSCRCMERAFRHSLRSKRDQEGAPPRAAPLPGSHRLQQLTLQHLGLAVQPRGDHFAGKRHPAQAA